MILEDNHVMSQFLTQYDVLSEIGEFLDTIPPSLIEKSVEEYKKFLHLKNLMKDTEIPAFLSPSEKIDQVWRVHIMRSSCGISY